MCGSRHEVNLSVRSKHDGSCLVPSGTGDVSSSDPHPMTVSFLF